MLDSFNYPLESLPVLYSAAPVPHCDSTADHTLHCCAIEAAEDFGLHAKFPQPPLEIQSQLGLLEELVGAVGPGQILTDMGSEEFAGIHSLYLCLTDV